MYTQTIFQAGNSDVVAIPRGLGLVRGDRVVVESIADDAVMIKKAHARIKPTKSEAGFQKWLKVFLQENSEILDELANR